MEREKEYQSSINDHHPMGVAEFLATALSTMEPRVPRDIAERTGWSLSYTYSILGSCCLKGFLRKERIRKTACYIGFLTLSEVEKALEIYPYLRNSFPEIIEWDRRRRENARTNNSIYTEDS